MTLRGPGYLFRHLTALLLAGVATAVFATPRAAAYEAVITDATVEVRSGAGRAYYPVGELERGDRVQVETELFGWYQIRCPEGVFSYVEAKNVNAKGDGSRGEVNTDRTSVYAAHADADRSPAESYRKLLDLERGDVVEIVATVDNYYKIIPPQTAFVFLPPKALAAAEAVAVTESPAAATPPATSSDPAPAEPVAETQPEKARLAPVITPDPPAAPPTQAQPAGPVGPALTEPPRPRPVPVAPAPPAAESAPATPPAPALAPDAAPAAPPAPRRVATMYPPAGEPVVRPAKAAAVPAAPAPAAGSGDLLTDPNAVVARPDVPVSSPAAHPRVVAVEAVMLPYFTLPVDEQPLAHMTRGYAGVAEIDTLTDGDRRLIESRLDELERNREMALALRAEPAPAAPDPAPASAAEGVPSGALVDAGGPAPAPTPSGPPAVAPAPRAPAAAPPAASAPAPAPAPAPGPVGPGYDAVGVLTVSTVHTGKNQPELLRLLDPSGQRTIAYLEPNADIDTVRMMGQLVGISGSSSYDPSLKLRLIKPDEIVVLGAMR